MTSEHAQHRRGLLLVAAGTFAWSIGGVVIRLLTVDSWTMLFWRSVVAGVFLLAAIALTERGGFAAAFRRLDKIGYGVAVCFASAWLFYLTSVTMTTIADALVIQATSPLIAGVLGWLLMRERVALRTWVAMAIALVGVAIMVWHSLGAGRIEGDLLAVVTAFSLSGAIVLIRHGRQVPMAPAICVGCGIATLFAWPFAAPLSPTATDIPLLIVFGVVQMGIGLLLVTAGARLIPAAEAALITTLETVLAPLWVWLAVGENPGTATIIGGGVVFAALIVHTLVEQRAERRNQSLIGSSSTSTSVSG